MKTKQLLLPIACLGIALGLFGCEKKSAIEPVPQKMAKADVSVKDGILVFKDWTTLRLYNANLNAKGIQYADEWEKSMHFESVAHILNEVNVAEAKLEESFLLGKSAEELKRLSNEPAPHTALYTRWVNAGTLRVEKEADGAEKVGVDASHTHYTNVMNSEGLVAAGDTIYQFKGNKIKVTTKGLANVVALKAATASEPGQQISVQVNPFRYDKTGQSGQQRSTNELTFDGNDYVDAYNNNHERSTIKVALFSEILDEAHKRNRVDFWIEATCEHKNFWGNWVNNEFGDGIYAIEADWSWNADVNPYIYARSTYLRVENFTVGRQTLRFLPDTRAGYIKMDYTTGAPQFGNQIFPNGTYTAYFDPSLGYNYYISQGIKINRGSTFKLIPVRYRPEALLTWYKI